MPAAVEPVRFAPAAQDDGLTARERLERIRRAARLVAGGSLGAAQVHRMGVEIERLAASLLDVRETGAGNGGLARLSHREREVLIALAAGETVQEVAYRFNRSPKTINNQRTNVLRKLELRNTAELTRFAIRSGLVTV